MKKHINKIAMLITGLLVVLAMVSADAADVTFTSIKNTTALIRDLDGVDARVISEGPIPSLAVLIDAGITASVNRVIVDLSDTTNYSHTATNEIFMVGYDFDMSLLAAGNWSYTYYIVTAIDGSGVMAKAFAASFTNLAGAGNQKKYAETPGAGIKLSNVVTADVAIAAITLSTDLASPSGTVNAAVGDVILVITESGGTTSLIGFAGIYYYTQ